MIQSIYQDIRQSFLHGNMIVRIIIINIALYMVLALTQALFPTFFGNIFPYIALSGTMINWLYKPWTLLTHMFSHTGFFHMAWNMIILYWFGNIVGDLIGDKKILPLYILGGLTGALFYMLSFQFLHTIAPLALGASAAVLAIVFAAVAVAPDYRVYLIILGPVKIKFIGLFILFFDLLGATSNVNAGGHIGHLGGTLFGFLFIYLLRKGIDLSDWPKNPSTENKKKRHLKVSYRADISKTQPQKSQSHTNEQEVIDKILEKIKKVGFDKLTEEEKAMLEQASNKTD